MILLIDNYDSFTWNLVQRLGEIDSTLAVGSDLRVLRNDEITAAAVETIDQGQPPTHILISPGPCTPRESGVSGDIIDRFAGRVPILGVCLGHQTMAYRDGMTVDRHDIPMHGKTSPLEHDGIGLYVGVSSPTPVMRYHSLVVKPHTIPKLNPGSDGWTISAWTDEIALDGSTRRVVMGLRRVWADLAKSPVEGVQFHPESFMTPEGTRMLANFLHMGE